MVFLRRYIFGNYYLRLGYNYLAIQTRNKTFSYFDHPIVRVGDIGFGIFVSNFLRRLQFTATGLLSAAFFFGFRFIYLIRLSLLGCYLFLF